jgi:type VI secretion system protein ImpH
MPSLRRALTERPGAFELFQAIRLLECDARAGRGDAALVAEVSHAASEPVRFRVRPGTAFPAGELAAFTERGAEETGPPEITVNAFGLFGPSGALPQAYTDLISEQLRERDDGLRNFLDLFNHRLIGLFYRAWAKYRLPVAYDRSPEGSDPISAVLFALIGLGQPSLKQRAPFPDAALLYYGGLFARAAPNAESLTAMLCDAFDRAIRVHQFQGRWLQLHEAEHSRLGGPHSRLGHDTVAGAKVWDIQGTFRIVVGPLNYPEFAAFMPGGPALTRLAQLTRLYVGAALTFDIQVVLHREAVPNLRLGGDEALPARLGWNTWATGTPMTQDAEDAVFRDRQAEAGGPA